MLKRFMLAALITTGCLTAGPAFASRVALVVGNGDYGFAPLLNPVRDARLVADQLAALDFEVLYATDVDKEGFRQAVDQAREKIAGADVFFLYYAGHALQYKGDNRLLMTDIESSEVEEVVDGSISVKDLISEVAEVNPKVFVLVLDACRDTPLAAADGVFQSGLSYVESSDQEMLIGYATSAGQVAYDGVGSNGHYAIALANALADPEVSLSRVFREVRRRVREVTAGAQIPWVSSSIENEIVLRDAVVPVPDAPTATLAADWVERLGDIVWTYVKTSNNPDYLAAFEAAFPRSPHASAAKDLVAMASPARSISIVDQASRAAAPAPIASAVVPLAEFGTTVDRFPIEEMRIWSLDLPDTGRGLRTLVDSCDLLAGDPDDPAGVTLGVHRSLVSTRDAIPVCGFAVARHPQEARYVFQLGRALDLAGHVDWAISLYTIAADRGYSQALVNLGHLYRFGVKVPADYGKAAEYYRRAALIGNPQARMGLAIHYMNGWGVPESLEESMLWARLAGAQGWTNAYDMLATHYAAGRGVEKNPEAAFKLYLYAAQMGQTNAMSNLGLAYLKGEGTAKDEALGYQWLGTADEKGNRYAAYHLGRLALKEDQAAAERHFLRSAEREFPQARFELAKLYDGQGKTEEAFFQIVLAQRLGLSGKVDELGETVSGKLSAGARAAVEARVVRWLEDNGY